MELTRAYKFRIYPDATRQEEIDGRLVLAQQFYNMLIEKAIGSYKSGKAKVSMARSNRFVKEIIQEGKKYPKLYSQTRCEMGYSRERGIARWQGIVARRGKGSKRREDAKLRLHIPWSCSIDSNPDN